MMSVRMTSGNRLGGITRSCERLHPQPYTATVFCKEHEATHCSANVS